jgi:hypothetical protein
MSSGSGSDSGSSSSYSGYDEAGISTPTSAYESIGSIDSGGGNDYSGPTYDEAGVISPTTTTTSDYRDDGPGYNPYASPTSTTASKDFYGAGDGRYNKDVMESGGSVYTNYADNVQRIFDKQAELEGFAKAGNIAAWALNPVGKATVLGATALADTIKANYMLGNFPSFSISGRTSSMQDAGTYSSDGGDQLQSYLTTIAPYAITGATPQQSQVMQYFNNMGTTQSPLSSSLETSYNQAKANVNNLLGVGSLQGQFGYSTQPYGGLSASNLATNPFNIPYLQQRGLI